MAGTAMTARDDLMDFAREALGLSATAPLEIFPLAGRGSDRAFYRLFWDRDSAILVHYDVQRAENTCYADLALFLHEIGVPAPRLIRHDPHRFLLLMEDLGDLDLFSFRGAPWETRRDLYCRTLAIVNRLHSFPVEQFPSGRVKMMEGFSLGLYRWERDYFREHFVKEVCGVELDSARALELEAELSALAERLNGAKRCLVHRDLQSQNVMARGGQPFLIDFQGLRLGNPLYDLGSLLLDPYVDFSEDERGELLSFYYGLSSRDLDSSAFQNCFWEAAAQRLMQALGAYGFLGRRKRLSAFLAHIPAGLRNLDLAAGRVSSLPRLQDLSRACQQHMKTK